MNPILKEIQERCYENLMDVCRAIAESLNVNTNAIMTIQVSNNYIFKLLSINIIYTQ